MKVSLFLQDRQRWWSLISSRRGFMHSTHRSPSPDERLYSKS